MHFSLVLCIFVTTVFTLVQCKTNFQPYKSYDYDVATEVNCMSVRRTVIGTMMNATCKPHYRHVPLKPMPSQDFYPAIVSVKRCDGNCPGHTCMPVKTQVVKVPVKLTQHHPNGNRNDMCAWVEVEEHIQCRCMCAHKEADCNGRQHYMKDRCGCVCKDREFAKHECESKMGRLWDDQDCSCNCTQINIQCESGLEWNREECKCM